MFMGEPQPLSIVISTWPSSNGTMLCSVCTAKPLKGKSSDSPCGCDNSQRLAWTTAFVGAWIAPPRFHAVFHVSREMQTPFMPAFRARLAANHSPPLSNATAGYPFRSCKSTSTGRWSATVPIASSRWIPATAGVKDQWGAAVAALLFINNPGFLRLPGARCSTDRAERTIETTS